MPVLLSLPTGIFGSYIALMVCGLDNNIYAQVALVMLIGLLAKMRSNCGVCHCKLQGGKQHYFSCYRRSKAASSSHSDDLFRFIAGLIPLCVASGAGAVGNRSIGTAAAGVC
jgi:hypothetical protein